MAQIRRRTRGYGADQAVINAAISTLRSQITQMFQVGTVLHPLAGFYPTLPGNGVAGTPVQNTESCMPVMFDTAGTIVAAGINCTTGVASSTYRLGLRADAGLGYIYPGALIADWGTVSTATTGWKEIASLSTAVTAYTIYWLSATEQGGTASSVTCHNAGIFSLEAALNTNSLNTRGYTQTGVTGALGVFSATLAESVTVPRISVKF